MEGNSSSSSEILEQHSKEIKDKLFEAQKSAVAAKNSGLGTAG